MNSENQCIFVSSRGILNSCSVKSKTPMSSVNMIINYDFSTIDNGCSLYVCGSAIKHFFINILPNLTVKFVLVTGDSDTDCFKDMLTEEEFIILVSNEYLIHWFAQNCIVKHPKLTTIPIGLDYHTISKNAMPSWGPIQTPTNQEQDLLGLRASMNPFYKRQIKSYANFHFSTHTKYGKDRIDAIDNISKDAVFYEPSQIPRLETWKQQLNYAFVISPHGGGYDCHRTWEALCLGCIPIMKSSAINSLFNELPVLIVDEWCNVTPELLKKTMIDYENKHVKKKFNYDKLLLSYWMNLFSNKTLQND